MSQQIGFSVLSAPLAAVDRRALSQAWYSALHLARDASPVECPAVRQKSTASGGSATAPPRQVRHAGPAGAAPMPPRAMRESIAERIDCGVDRRAARSPLARRIEREFLRPLRPARRATFSIAGDGSRVHVTLQGSGPHLRLVAVCSSRLRSTVARAISEARYALASRGIALELVVRGTQPCK